MLSAPILGERHRDLQPRLCQEVMMPFAHALAMLLAVLVLAADHSQAAAAQLTQKKPEVDATTQARRDEPPPEPEEVQAGQPSSIEDLERRVQRLAEELEQLRESETEPAPLTKDAARALGLAPSAATAYVQSRGLSIAGYGEMLYQDFSRQDQAGRPAGIGSQIDFLRAVTYFGYRFDDKFVFNSEFELEHANEASVEFAYIDYLAHEQLGLRGGLLLVPLGLVNEYHEPTVFLGAARPVTEQRIIPSTWRENGAGIHGSTELVTYRAYAMAGLDATGFSANGLRSGRQKGSTSQASDVAFAGRLDLTPAAEVLVGASLFTGGSSQDQVQIGGDLFGVRTTIFDLHGYARFGELDVRGLYTRASVQDAAELNQFLGLSGSAGIGEVLEGGYVQVGYDAFSGSSVRQARLTPYVRLERVDTQARMPAGFTRSLATRNTFVTVGVELKPIPLIVVKADYTWVSNDAESGVRQFNVALGYAF